MICHWEVVVLSTDEEKRKCQYWKFSYYLKKKGCLQLIWWSMMASLFLNKWGKGERRPNLSAYTALFQFFPNMSLKIAMHILWLSNLRFAGVHYCWSCLEVFWRRLWFVSSLSAWVHFLSPVFDSIISLELLQTPSLGGSSDFYQLYFFFIFYLNLSLPFSFNPNSLCIFFFLCYPKNVGYLPEKLNMVVLVCQNT